MRKLLVAAIVMLSAGCWEDERPLLWERSRTILGPVPMKSQIAYVDSALDRVTLLDLAEDPPAISTQRIGRRAIAAVPSPDRHLLFVVTRGEEATVVGEINQPPLLWVVDTTRPASEPIAYEIGSPFDRVAVAPDNRTVVAYFSESGPDEAGFFRNPNELAVVHLDEPPSGENPTLKTIRSFGAVPEGMFLSPPMVVPGADDATPRTFAFVLSSNNLTMVDATYPARREVSIRLDLGGPPVIPREVVFAPSSASAYVRSDNARDVLQIVINPIARTGEDTVDFSPLLSELGAGGAPTDIAVYDDASGRRRVLAATPSTREVVVIDADTGQFRAVPIDDPIDRILLFPSGGDTPPTKALFASVGWSIPRVHVLDLVDIDDPLTQADIRTITLEQGIRDAVPVPGRNLAMLVHTDNREVLGLLDIDTESSSPLLGVGRLDSYDFSPTGTHLIGATSTVSRIGFVALDNLHPTNIRLDDPPARLLATANGKVFVDHGDPLGHATIIPSPTATRPDARVLTGFLTTNLLEEGLSQ
jgi:hypothetical protein